ncbi:MAG: type II toxin-antitoxin system RelE/ParE family toxin [Rhodanobacteraceae bacterium]
MRIEWLRKAAANLDAEASYIASDNPQAAARSVSRILAAVELLAQQPDLGRPGRIHGTRELIVSGSPYIVPYRVKNGCVQILRVFHSARRAPGSW